MKSLATKSIVLAIVASTAIAAPAEAAETSVTSPACGQIKVTNTSTRTGVTFYTQADDNAFFSQLTRGGTQTFSRVPAGTFTWQTQADTDMHVTARGRVTVKPCSATYPRRLAAGDQNGDALADIFAIWTTSGDLSYYQSLRTGVLRSGVKIGWAWNRMRYIQQVKSLSGRNYLIAVRDDGTIWRYDNFTTGRVSNGRQIGAGFGGWKDFAILPPNNDIQFGENLLVANNGRALRAFPLSVDQVDPALGIQLHYNWSDMTKTLALQDFDGDSLADIISITTAGDMFRWRVGGTSASQPLVHSPRRVGYGWKSMGLVTAAGSLNGDWNTDLIARKPDGALYKYINLGGKWGSAQRIGVGWNGIRLLA